MKTDFERSFHDTKLIYSCEDPLELDRELLGKMDASSTMNLSLSGDQRFQHEILCPVGSYSEKDARGQFTVEIDTTGAIPLDRWLGFDRDASDIRILITCLAEMLDYSLQQGILLKNVDFDPRVILFYPPHQRFYFAVLPVKGLQVDLCNIRSLLADMPQKIRPEGEEARELCEQWQRKFASVMEEPINPYLYCELLNELLNGDSDEQAAEAGLFSGLQPQDPKVKMATPAPIQAEGAEMQSDDTGSLTRCIAEGVDENPEEGAPQEEAPEEDPEEETLEEEAPGTTVLPGSFADSDADFQACEEMEAPGTTVLPSDFADNSPNPQVHVEATPTETTVMVDVYPVSVQMEVKNTADPEPWARGKHLRVDPGTGVLNSFQSEEEARQLLEQKDQEGQKDQKDPEVRGGSHSQELPPDSTPEKQPAAAEDSQDRSAPKEGSSAQEKPAEAPAVEKDASVKTPTPIQASKEPAPVDTYILVRQRTNERVTLQGQNFVVGKSKYCSFQVTDTTTVSRRHAVFVCGPDLCQIIDNDSKNGTFVNDHRLQPKQSQTLQQGDVIRMSDEMFIFEGAGSASEGAC